MYLSRSVNPLPEKRSIEIIFMHKIVSGQRLEENFAHTIPSRTRKACGPLWRTVLQLCGILLYVNSLNSDASTRLGIPSTYLIN